jgi:hypothetical protein
MRLNQIARKFNVGTETIIVHLAKSGITIDNNPNTKITKQHLTLLEKAFSSIKIPVKPPSPPKEVKPTTQYSIEKKEQKIVPPQIVSSPTSAPDTSTKHLTIKKIKVLGSISSLPKENKKEAIHTTPKKKVYYNKHTIKKTLPDIGKLSKEDVTKRKSKTPTKKSV